jgi:hypothetical protein
MTDWFENDGLFLTELQDGHREAIGVADRLRDRGLAVEVTPFEWRETIDHRHRFADEVDLTVGTRAPCHVDVKSRRLSFRGPSDYPWPTALVDTVSGWEAKTRKPVAVILVSKTTGGLAVVRSSTRAQWTTSRRFDSRRGIEDSFFEVDKELLAPFDEFVEWLHQRDTPPG